MTAIPMKTSSAALTAVILSLFLSAFSVGGAQTPRQKPGVRFLQFSEVAETLGMYSASGIPGSEIKDEAQWDSWIRAQDKAVRDRIDLGTEDSISNLILFGTSFTNLPRLEGTEQAVDLSGLLTSAARQRVRAFLQALEKSQTNERLSFARFFLAQKGVADHALESYLASNLVRMAREQAEYEEKLKQATQAGAPDQLYFTRGTLFQARGLSADTSLLPNFALEETLRSLVAKGAAPPAIRRIAVIGPGLDFADKRAGYDFYPLQTIQPFAIMEAAVRTGLAKPDEVRVVTLDLNAAVNSHVATVAERAKAGLALVLQLPWDTQPDWTVAAKAYWQHFGETLGKPAKALAVPKSVTSIENRAVSIPPQVAARVEARDANVVAQTMDLVDGKGFDLVIATNVLVYYDLFQQGLAIASIANIMNPGGIFLCNNALPARHDHRLKYLGRKSLSYVNNGAFGDDVVVYRRE